MTLQERYKDDPRRAKLVTREEAITLLMNKLEQKAAARKKADEEAQHRETVFYVALWGVASILAVFLLVTGI